MVILSNNSILSHRKLAAHTSQLKQETERLTLQKARELDAFDQQNHGALPQYSDKHFNRDRNEFHGANSVKTTSFEQEALRTMKAFWLPSCYMTLRSKSTLQPPPQLAQKVKKSLK
ncbi:hypothetical protein HanHA300_Chr10g0375311 [Helianthus annuus]|nr:hypothetical protein HanHA300_Chr10g0375311 [Helianthus annuus]KAJ0697964.1 hypothetical protein HanLR1_Chr10g0374921 [Helianthus annuus]KAJ0701333.1 hypothetical protein HanOQP8_Chr10g0378251 [Helianthus annuus]